MSDWDCPHDIGPGDLVEVHTEDGYVLIEIINIHAGMWGTYATGIDCSTGQGYSLDMNPFSRVEWRRHRITERCLPDVVEEYGAVCAACDELFEHAVKSVGFKCYRCKEVWGV